jgi:hypothetical protein
MGLSSHLRRALEEQLAVRDRAVRSGARHWGWKVGGGEAEHLDGYVMGSITTATVLEVGDLYRSAPFANTHADAEVVVVMGGQGLIGAYTCGLELCDVSDGPDPGRVVAANIFHRAVSASMSRSAVLPAGARGRLLIDGDLVAEALVPEDVDERVACVGALLRAMGRRLAPGDAVLTGSVVQVPVGPGGLLRAEIDGLGTTELRVVSG